MTVNNHLFRGISCIKFCGSLSFSLLPQNRCYNAVIEHNPIELIKEKLKEKAISENNKELVIKNIRKTDVDFF